MNTNKNIVSIVALSLFLLFSATAHAQQWRQFTTLDGLASSLTSVMLEDQRGNLWVGTDDGLSQFNRFFKTHLRKSFILSLLESSDGSIWAGTTEGLWQYDGTQWQPHDPLKGFDIKSLLESSDRSIWAGTSGAGLWQYDSAGWQPHDPLDGFDIKSLLESSDGSICSGNMI